MINPDDIKAGMVLGQADAEILRDAISRLNGMELELLTMRKAREGWKLVPVEPTEEMIAAWRKDMDQSYAKESAEKIGEDEVVFAYQAMLAASPAAPQ